VREFRKFHQIIWPELVREPHIQGTIQTPETQREKIIKRDQECTSLNGSYNSNGTVFNVFCNTSWQYYDSLHISFTLDFSTCINGCEIWNIDQTQNECVGAQWKNDVYGPAGGKLCTYLWTMPNGNQFPANDTDTVQLRNGSRVITANVQFFKYLLI